MTPNTGWLVFLKMAKFCFFLPPLFLLLLCHLLSLGENKCFFSKSEKFSIFSLRIFCTRKTVTVENFCIRKNPLSKGISLSFRNRILERNSVDLLSYWRLFAPARLKWENWIRIQWEIFSISIFWWSAFRQFSRIMGYSEIYNSTFLPDSMIR